MKPGVYNIECKQGASWDQSLNWTAGGDTVDLTGYTARLVVRYKAGSPNILLDCTTENERITLGGTPNNIVIEVARDVTALLSPGSYVYDLELSSAGGRDYPVLTGRFEVKPSTVPA